MYLEYWNRKNFMSQNYTSPQNTSKYIFLPHYQYFTFWWKSLTRFRLHLPYLTYFLIIPIFSPIRGRNHFSGSIAALESSDLGCLCTFSVVFTPWVFLLSLQPLVSAWRMSFSICCKAGWMDFFRESLYAFISGVLCQLKCIGSAFLLWLLLRLWDVSIHRLSEIDVSWEIWMPWVAWASSFSVYFQDSVCLILEVSLCVLV